MRTIRTALLLSALTVAGCLGADDQTDTQEEAASSRVALDVLMSRFPDSAMKAQLSQYGRINDTFTSIPAVTLVTTVSQVAAVRALPFVVSATPDTERDGAPVDTVQATDFTGGINTWDHDAINVSNFGAGRTVAETGAGVYVAILDTGLMDSWKQYFPQERIATQYARAFGGGGGEAGSVSSQPEKWGKDVNGHGTHVTSTILGYSLRGVPVGGAAPMATVIPVKVLNQNGSGWSSVVARGIVYVGDLKAGPLANVPVVINMSLGGPGLDALEKAAIDYAVGKGVIIVAAAGNEGTDGMGYPGAYAPVISVAAAGWTGEWVGGGSWWYGKDVPEADASSFYITDFSSRQLAGQDLDVAAPGSWVVGPYQVNQGQTAYYFLGGTSMASPHVAGLVALLCQADPSLNAADAEAVLSGTALPLPAGSRTIFGPDGIATQVTWGNDASGAGLVDAAAALAAVK
ncbi:MAG TPA: S8 family serine peptidase [Kofleriaceae bacterium]|nr:S8 family serine peptidase [Kofleriaceae bacterium]